MRERMNLTQRQLARLLGRPQSYVSKCETGERRVDPVEWLGICEAMGVSFEDSAAELRKRLSALPAKPPSS